MATASEQLGLKRHEMSTLATDRGGSQKMEGRKVERTSIDKERSHTSFYDGRQDRHKRKRKF